MDNRKAYDVLICLVGENPLPIYLGIKQFAHATTRIVLVQSELTQDAADGVAKCMSTENVTPFFLRDPFSPMEVYKDLERLAKDHIGPAIDASLSVACNYTGGTKVMSSVSFHFLATKYESLMDLFYLAESGGTDAQGAFHFWPGGYTDPLRTGVSIDDLCVLHGVELQQPNDSNKNAHNGTSDNNYAFCTNIGLMNLWSAAQEGPEGRLRRIRKLASDRDDEKHSRLVEEYRSGGFTWPSNGVWWSFLEILDEETRKDWMLPRNRVPFSYYDYKDTSFPYRCKSGFCKRVEFATGTWLEVFIKKLIQSMSINGVAPFGQSLVTAERLVSRIAAGTELSYLNPQYDRLLLEKPPYSDLFESDLIMVVHNNLRYISVTTSDSPKTCKLKIFEAKHRADQIGGGLARYCVVSLASADRVRQCQATVKANRRVIFGMDDIREWVGDSENEPNVGSLREFLTA